MLDDALTQELETARQRKRLPPATQRRRIRERAGLTQTALARVLEVDRATLSRWESGQRTPRAYASTYLAALERLEREAP